MLEVAIVMVPRTVIHSPSTAGPTADAACPRPASDPCCVTKKAVGKISALVPPLLLTYTVACQLYDADDASENLE